MIKIKIAIILLVLILILQEATIYLEGEEIKFLSNMQLKTLIIMQHWKEHKAFIY